MGYCFFETLKMFKKDEDVIDENYTIKLHEKYGYFDTQWPTAADHEFWLRCHRNGAIFHKIYEILGLYYYNPEGLSTHSETSNMQEGVKIRNLYLEKGY